MRQFGSHTIRSAIRLHRITALTQHAGATLLLACGPLTGTSIVGIWTEKQVTIAADSKQTLVTADGRVTTQTACKVFPVRDFLVAIAGLVQHEQTSVIAAIQNAREFRDNESGAVLSEMGPWIAAQSALERVLDSRHERYNPDVNAAIIMGGTAHGKAWMYKVVLRPVPPILIDGRPSVNRFSPIRIAYPEMRGYKGTDRKRGVEVIGIADAITRFQTILPDWKNGSDPDVAKRLIAVEASDSRSSHSVGPPFSVIVIGGTGSTWVDRGACRWQPGQ